MALIVQDACCLADCLLATRQTQTFCPAQVKINARPARRAWSGLFRRFPLVALLPALRVTYSRQQLFHPLSTSIYQPSSPVCKYSLTLCVIRLVNTHLTLALVIRCIHWRAYS